MQNSGTLVMNLLPKKVKRYTWRGELALIRQSLPLPEFCAIWYKSVVLMNKLTHTEKYEMFKNDLAILLHTIHFNSDLYGQCLKRMPAVRLLLYALPYNA